MFQSTKENIVIVILHNNMTFVKGFLLNAVN